MQNTVFGKTEYFKTFVRVEVVRNFKLWLPLVRSTFDRVDLIKPVTNVHPSVRTYVCTCICLSVHPQKRFLDFNEIWRVCRG